MKTIGVVTSGRSDYGICLPILRQLAARSDVQLQIFVTGMHLSAAHGRTVTTIESDGFPIAERVDMLVDGDTPEAVASSMGRGTLGFAAAFGRCRLDLLLVPGDRFEVHAAAVAALPFEIGIAHLHGGELSYYAIDDSFRHSLTKLSHLHFVATEEYATRVKQMGEEPWRVVVSGAPALENIKSIRQLSRSELETRVGLALDPPPLLVTFHPVTRDLANTDAHVSALLEALRGFPGPMILTLPNADASGRRIADAMRAFVDETPRARFIPNLGVEAYFSMMRVAAAMVGNSSSGLVEAPSFGLPVVNIGERQAGRVRAANVIDCGSSRAEISAAIERACAPQFRTALIGFQNPYANADGVRTIVDVLATTPVDTRLLVKRFHDCAVTR